MRFIPHSVCANNLRTDELRLFKIALRDGGFEVTEISNLMHLRNEFSVHLGYLRNILNAISESILIIMHHIFKNIFFISKKIYIRKRCLLASIDCTPLLRTN